MKQLHYFVAGGCLALIIAVPAASAQTQGTMAGSVQEPSWKELRLADNEVLGVVDPGGILVTALETEPGAVGFVVDLGNGVLFEGTEDHVGGLLSLRLVDAAGLPHAIEGLDLELLARAYHALVQHPEILDLAAADSLLRYLNWIAEAPLGTTIDVQVALPAALATSLCKKVGKNVTAYWDHITGSSSKAYRLDCAQGDCMGRCGQGCGDGFGPAYAVQQFTQDCLNHDGCVDALGYLSPSCQDEFLATADDAAVAKDCNAIAGVWKLKYKTTPSVSSRRMNFSMNRKGKFTGDVHVAQGRYVTIKGKRENPPPLLKGATIKVPLWMTSSACDYAPLGFAKATVIGVNYCGKIRGRLTGGTWNTFRDCRMSTPLGWTGKVVLKRKKW